MSEPKSMEKITQLGAEWDEASLTVSIDPELEKKLVRKLDLFIIPVYVIIYIFSFLDRSDIGNAKVAGMAIDLKLKVSEFNVIMTLLANGDRIWPSFSF
jgi:hypothetical protein